MADRVVEQMRNAAQGRGWPRAGRAAGVVGCRLAHGYPCERSCLIGLLRRDCVILPFCALYTALGMRAGGRAGLPKSWYAKACLHPGARPRGRLRFPIRLRRPSSVPSPTALHPAFSAPASDRASPHPRLISWIRVACAAALLAVLAACGTTKVQPGYYRVQSGDTLTQIARKQASASATWCAGTSCRIPTRSKSARPCGSRRRPASRLRPSPAGRAPSPQAAGAGPPRARTAPPGAISLVWPAQGKVTRGYDGSGSNGIVISCLGHLGGGAAAARGLFGQRPARLRAPGDRQAQRQLPQHLRAQQQAAGQGRAARDPGPEDRRNGQ